MLEDTFYYLPWDWWFDDIGVDGMEVIMVLLRYQRIREEMQ